MRLPELQRILVEGARRQEHAGALGRLLARIRARPLVALLPVLLVGAASAGAVVTLTPTRSRPLSGTVPSGRPGEPLHYTISVFPNLGVGQSGWRAWLQYSFEHQRQGFGESEMPTGLGGGLLLDEGGEAGEYRSEMFALVSDAVAQVRLRDGQTVTPTSSPRLPRATRAYVVFGPPPSSRGMSSVEPVTFLNAQGKPFPEHHPPRHFTFALPLRRLDPRHPGDAACAVHLKRNSGIVAIRQTISGPGPWPTPEPDALLSCSNATYRVRGGTVVVAVLVNASDPHRRAPALPGLTREAAHPGILAGREIPPGELGPQPPNGGLPRNPADVSARREGVAWLVAEGGTASARATLLRLLSTHV